MRSRVPGILATGVVASVALIGAVYRADIREAHDRVRGKSTVVRSPYGNIEYTEGGEGTPVLVIHGSAGGFFWGSVIDRVGPKRTLTVVLLLWMVTLILGVLIPILALPDVLFFLVGIMAGVALGGTWASDRTLMLRLSPPRYLGQFYGLYAMVGRFGQIIGPLLWGFIAVTLGLGRPLALASLIVIVAVAFVILRPVSDARREWEADELV